MTEQQNAQSISPGDTGIEQEEFVELISGRSTPVKYLAFGMTLSFTGNFSNSGPAEYDVVTPALVLSARIAF